MDTFLFLFSPRDCQIGLTSNAAVLQFTDKASGVVKIAIPRVGVNQDGNGTGVVHELQNLQHLCPGSLVAVSDPQLSSYRQPAGPDTFKTCGIFRTN